MARAAASGDGSAFAALYERYEQRAFNLAYRITCSEADAADAVREAFLDLMRRPPGPADDEPGFGPRLFAATRNAGYDLMHKRGHTRPSETNLELRQVDVGEASMRLPERQREVLALRDLEELSYDEIAAIMEVNGNAVAQLISRARINLCDEMRGTALASVAAPSAECERAMLLIARRDDGQLDAASGDGAWLDAHLAGCRRCRVGVEAMQEADASYRAWAPIAAAPWLLKETMAKAAELAGADWSEATADAAAPHSPAESQPGTPSAYRTDPGRGRSPRRRVTLAAGLAVLLLLAGVGAVFAGDDPSTMPADLTTGATPALGGGAPERGGDSAKAGKAKQGAAEKKGGTEASGVTETVDEETVFTPVQTLPTGGGAASEPASHHSTPGESAVDPPQQASDPTPGSSKPKPAPAPAAQPTSAPAPVATEEAPAAEESPDEPPHGNGQGRGPPEKPGHPAK